MPFVPICADESRSQSAITICVLKHLGLRGSCMCMNLTLWKALPVPSKEHTFQKSSAMKPRVRRISPVALLHNARFWSLARQARSSSKKKTCPKTCPKKRRIHLSAFHLNGTNTSTTCHPSISLCIDLPLFTSIYLICSSWSSWLILSKQHRGLPTAAAIAFSLPPGNGQFRGV